MSSQYLLTHGKLIRLTKRDGQPLSTLASICISTLANYLDDYLDALGCEIYSCLPSEQANALAALCMRRGLLTDRILHSLTTISCLDLSHANIVSDRGLRDAMMSTRCSGLNALSLEGIRITKATLTAIAASCPSLCLLRLGKATLDQGSIEALPSLLPRVEANASHVASSWEELVAEDSTAADDRFNSLRVLVWPSVPPTIEKLIAKQCPKIKLNLRSSSFSKEEWNPLDPQHALDIPFILDLPHSHSLLRNEDDCPECDKSSDDKHVDEESCHKHPLSKQPIGLPDFLSMAERFRQAYISQAQRMEARKEKAEAAAFRRRLRSSLALRIEEQWLDEI